MEGSNVPVLRGRARLAGAALVVLQLLALAAPAAAAPIPVAEDSVDGSLTFRWNPDTAKFTPVLSSILIERGDRVTFYADARSKAEAEVGKRLVGRLSLTLNGRRRVRYSGIFTFEVKSAGEVSYHATKEASFTLRAVRGPRKKVVRFPFDLPNRGKYDVDGRFVATP